jgi:hypothetical protein
LILAKPCRPCGHSVTSAPTGLYLVATCAIVPVYAYLHPHTWSL